MQISATADSALRRFILERPGFQPFMPRSAVVVLGAGFSRGAGGPILNELLDEQRLRHSAGSRQILRLLADRVEVAGTPAHDSNNIEALFTEVWQEARTAGQLELGGKSFAAGDVLHELLVHLSSVAAEVSPRGNSRLARQIQEYLRAWIDGHETLTLVTFNYDMLVERMLDFAGVLFDEGGNEDFAFVDSGRARAVSRKGSEVTLLKLHGSVSWGICPGCRRAEVGDVVVSIFESPYVPRRRRACPFCGDKYVDPGIIPPIAGKAGELRYMEPVWRSARKAIRECQRLEIVGYSLPATDAEAASLLRGGSHLSTGGAVSAICGERGASVRLRNLFPNLVDQRSRFEDYLEVHHTA